jgi:uncharacterized protein
MPSFVLNAEQYVPKPLEKVFAFFSDAENLQKLTPLWLHFHIRSVNPAPLAKGTLIRYSMRWRIFPVSWTTEIVESNPPHRFVDLQLKGPYKLWRHEHLSVFEGEGTRIFDRLDYALPFGILGQIAHEAVVKRDVAAIFAYRREAIERHLGSEISVGK